MAAQFGAHKAGSPAREASARGVSDSREGPEVDRFHNLEPLSNLVMTGRLREMEESLAALDERIAALEDGDGSARQMARRLGADMIDMGGALDRRLTRLERTLRKSEPPASTSTRSRKLQRDERPLAWAVGLGGLLALVLVGFGLAHDPNASQGLRTQIGALRAG